MLRGYRGEAAPATPPANQVLRAGFGAATGTAGVRPTGHDAGGMYSRPFDRQANPWRLAQ